MIFGMQNTMEDYCCLYRSLGLTGGEGGIPPHSPPRAAHSGPARLTSAHILFADPPLGRRSSGFESQCVVKERVAVIQTKKLLAERVGFEPTVPCGTLDFESSTIGHSDTSPLGQGKYSI